MKRIWDFSKPGGRGGSQAPAQPAPPQPMPPGPMGPETELIEPPDDEVPERYLARPIRPAAQLAVRIGLWGAVLLGCVGGIRALVAPAESGEEPVAQDIGDADVLLPAPVAGVAENGVQAWLTAGPEDQERLDLLFIDAPSVQDLDNATLTLIDMRTVAGQRLEDGYWTVTVAADVIETDRGAETDGTEPVDTVDTDDDGIPDEPNIVTWYVEVGVVGDVRGALALLTTPAVVPAPPAAESQWKHDPGEDLDPGSEDQLTQTIDGFLTALLAADDGDSDVSRYLAPEVELEAADPAPFTEIEVAELAFVELDSGDIRVWAKVRADTRTNAFRMVAYEIVVRERVDRWEVVSVWGAPTVSPVPEDTEPPTVAEGSPSASDADDESSEETDESTETSDPEAEGSEPDGSPPPEEGDSSETTDTTIELPAE